MSLIEIISRWLLKIHNKNQSTFCFCPRCGLELCNSESWYADADSDLVRYQCVQCGHRSTWLFDCPAPILIKEEK